MEIQPENIFVHFWKTFLARVLAHQRKGRMEVRRVAGRDLFLSMSMLAREGMGGGGGYSLTRAVRAEYVGFDVFEKLKSLK